jgi:LmbE family N-acetylglucosaminyl deacetylase
MNVLCVATHPDDEVIGVGGTLRRHSENGDEVRVVILSNAEPARHEKITPEVEAKMEMRKESTRKACDHLGVDSVEFYDYPDNSFDTVPLLDIVKTVEEEILSFDPDIIYTHHYGDLNISHELTSRAVITATRPLPESNIKRVYAYETLSNSEWSAPRNMKSFQPTFFIDIGDQLASKMEAVRAHEMELREHPHPRNVKDVHRNAKLWGAKSGVQAAEPFELLRGVSRDIDLLFE